MAPGYVLQHMQVGKCKHSNDGWMVSPSCVLRGILKLYPTSSTQSEKDTSHVSEEASFSSTCWEVYLETTYSFTDCMINCITYMCNAHIPCFLASEDVESCVASYNWTAGSGLQPALQPLLVAVSPARSSQVLEPQIRGR